MTSAPARRRTSEAGDGRTWRAASGAWLGIGAALTVLAAALPALVPPMAAEFARRRRGRPGHPVATWIWAPGAAVAVGLTLAGHGAAAPLGLAVSTAATVLPAWFRRTRRDAVSTSGWPEFRP